MAEAAAPANVYLKLMQARIALQGKKLAKTGHNKFAGYKYFELGDFLPTTQEIFLGLGLCGFVSYSDDLATLTIIDTQSGQSMAITSPMSSASLKGAHDIQNLGAVQTYLRRYLWVTAMEIVEHDALDAVLGSEESRNKAAAESRATGARRQATTVKPIVKTRTPQPQGHGNEPLPQAVQESLSEVNKHPQPDYDGPEPSEDEEVLTGIYEKMTECGVDRIGIQTLCAVLNVTELSDVPLKSKKKLLNMLTPDYAKLLNLGQNSKGEQIIEVPEEEVDAPEIDEIEQALDEVM
ncbi:MAG: ERF family protein [Bacteroidota bacterium]|jgi:hypothetical protein